MSEILDIKRVVVRPDIGLVDVMSSVSLNACRQSEQACATSAASAAAQAAGAADSESRAAASAASAAVSAASLAATSASAVAVGVGTKTFTTQAGKNFPVGAMLMIASASNPASYMHGQVTSYSGSSLTVSVTDAGGSGSPSDWNIGLSGTQGTQGIQGIQGIQGPAGVPNGGTANQALTKVDATGGNVHWSTIDKAFVGLGSVTNDSQVKRTEMGAASGVATLDANSKAAQEPASKAQASGIASLDANSKVVQDPASKGQANGVAGLGADGKVPTAQLPAVSNANLLADTSTSPNSYVLTPSPAKASYSTDDIFYMQARAGITGLTGTVPSGYQVSTTSGNATITFTQGTTIGLAAGMSLSGTGISGTISSITDQTHLVMSANASATNTGVALTVTKGVTGTISGGTTVTLTSGTTANLLPGMYVTGSGIPASTQILSVQDSTHFTLSNVSTNASGIAITATIPVVAITLASGTTSGLSAGYSITGSIIPIITTTITSIVDSTHLLCSAVPASGTAVALAFNSGTNLGACTVNVNGLGAKAIKLPDSSDPLPGHLRAGGVYALKPDGTNVQLLNKSDYVAGVSTVNAYSMGGTSFTFTQGITCPSYVNRVFVQCYGGGGGGGNSASWAMGGGGGGYAEGWVSLTPNQSVTVTIGAGGGAGGGNGGTSSFGSAVSAAPGTGGGPAGGSPGSGGTANVGTYTVNGSGGTGSSGGPCNGPGGGAGGGAAVNGGSPGGGGGGGNTSNPNTPGTGGVGRVAISW